jgi:hypothetical protein
VFVAYVYVWKRGGLDWREPAPRAAAAAAPPPAPEPEAREVVRAG